MATDPDVLAAAFSVAVEESEIREAQQIVLLCDVLIAVRSYGVQLRLQSIENVLSPLEPLVVPAEVPLEAELDEVEESPPDSELDPEEATWAGARRTSTKSRGCEVSADIRDITYEEYDVDVEVDGERQRRRMTGAFDTDAGARLVDEAGGVFKMSDGDPLRWEAA